MTYPASGRTVVSTPRTDPVHEVVAYAGAAVYALVVLVCLPALLHPSRVFLDAGQSLCAGRALGDDVLYAVLWLLALGCVAAAVKLVTEHGPLWLAGGGVAALLVATLKGTTVSGHCLAAAGSAASSTQRPLLLAGLVAAGAARFAYTRLK